MNRNNCPRLLVPWQSLKTSCRSGITVYVALCFLFSFQSVSRADTQTKVEHAPREIYVPFNDLNVLLEQQPQRVLLSRGEYEALLAKAKKTFDARAPKEAMLLSADYKAILTLQRAEIAGTLGIEILEDGLHALPLDLGKVGLKSAKLDGRAAALGQAGKDAIVIFVEGKGRHELQLEMTAPVIATAAKQQLQYRLPRPPAAKMQLIVQGDVEIKSGAAVLSRSVEPISNPSESGTSANQESKAKETRFEILPREGDVTLEMSLNSHLQRSSHAFAARSVLIDEITEGYEKLHAAVSLEILYGPMDEFRFALPDGFEVTEITSPLLARWDVQELGGKKIALVKLREKTTETTVLYFTLLRTPSRLADWKSPILAPIPSGDNASEIVAQSAIVGLMVEDRLKAESIDAGGLIAIDAEVLAKALPASIRAPGTPTLDAVAAYYAPEGKFELAAKFRKPAVETAVSTSLLWRVSDRGYKILGGFTLLPRGEKRFSFDFTTPPDWTLLDVTSTGDVPLKFERFGDADKDGRVRVYVPNGMAPDQEFKINFKAAFTPKGWLGDWTSMKRDFPVFAVMDAVRDEGAIAVEASDDIVVRPETLKSLVPLDNAEKAGYELEGVTVNLAYRYENPQYAASVAFERTVPRLSARTYSFLHVTPEGLNGHYEVIYNIDEARTRTLSLVLPENSPTALSIHGLDGVDVKEFSAEPVKDNKRTWRVHLSEPKRGKVRLAVDFQQPLSSQEAKKMALPMLSVADVVYQSGLVAVEGCAEFNVEVTTKLRKVDVGELANADYQPGRRLVGVFGFAGDPPEIKVDVSRNPNYPLYAAIMQKASLVTDISANGESQTEAEFTISTKELYLELRMPAGSELWSAEIDGAPIKPQREGKSILLGMASAKGNIQHNMKVVYRTTIAPFGSHGLVELAGPKLFLRSELAAESVEVPLVDLQWRLRLPNGYEVVRSTGTVATNDIASPKPAALVVAGSLYELSGGVGQHGLLPTLSMSARESARRATDSVNRRGYDADKTAAPAPYYLEDDVQYHSPTRKSETKADAPASCVPPTDAPTEETMAAVDELKKTEAALKTSEKPALDAMTDSKAESEKTSENYDRINNYSSMELAKLNEEPETPQNAVPQPPREISKYSIAGKQSGFRSLKISLHESNDSEVSFHGLGGDAVLCVELAERERFSMLGWGVAIVVFLFGAAMTRRPIRTKLGYVVLLTVAATIVAAIWDSLAVVWVCNMIFYSACILAAYYLMAGCMRRICSRCCPAFCSQPSKKVVTAAILLAWTCMFSTAHAQEPTKEPSQPIAIQIVGPEKPVTVPDDAILVPYDPILSPTLGSAEGDWAKKSEKLLVPYSKYVELWNLAHPDKKIEAKKLPADYALAGASYKTTLEGNEFLSVVGELEIEVFSSEFVQISLNLSGGALTQAKLDGSPARLGFATVASPAVPVPQMSASQQPVEKSAQFFLLTFSGKGRHKLEITIRMKIAQGGGWRNVEGELPFAPASSCAITVPHAQTEVRLPKLVDRQNYDIEKPGETISTVLGPNGSLAVRWRAKAAVTKVDLGLTAQSDAVLDVGEDGLRWTWLLELDFRGKSLEEFAVDVPSMYVVEKVEGGNLRGWTADKNASGQTLKIALLAAAKDREQVVLTLSKSGAIGHDKDQDISAEFLKVDQAAMHTGRILILRSPLLDLRTLDRAEMTRSDIPTELLKLAESKNAERPLLAKPFEAYRFDRTPSSGIRFAAQPIAPKMTADVQAILKITDANRSLDGRIAFQVKDRPVYRLQAYLPDDFQLDHLLPGDLEYSVAAKDGRRLLSVFLRNGRIGQVEMRIQGVLGKSGQDQVALPRIEAIGVEQQRIELAVQASDACEVEAVELKNCERVLASRLYGWLKPEQRPLTRLAIESRGGDYDGAVKLVPKKPEITCDTLTNVRVTDRAIEETILLDYRIKNAGARSFSFVLPWWMKDAKINVPFLREKSNEPLGSGDKSPRLVKIELQVEATGLCRVLIENDRQLENTPQETPIPTVNGISGGRRFVTLESFGRDEMHVEKDKLSGMENLVQGQKDWNRLKELLDITATFAYLAKSDVKNPRLVYRTNERTTVHTADARILLADTFLFLDDNGAYRAKQNLRLFNSTEQFLEIELPPGAELWTAIVAGEPIKPVRENPKDPRGVKIPLVKTAAGDLDYEVVLGYGGTIAEIGNLSTIEFPLARCVNLQPELSIVQLSLRKDRKWFDFDGTMRLTDEAGANACRVSTNTKVIENLQQTLSQSSQYGKLRTAASLKQQNAANSLLADNYGSLELRREIDKSKNTLSAAMKMAEQVENAPDKSETRSNRGKVREQFRNQNVDYAGKKLVQTGGNWSDSTASEVQSEKPGEAGQQINGVWLRQNKLSDANEATEGLDRNIQGGKPENVGGQSKGARPAAPAKPSAAQFAEGRTKQELVETNSTSQMYANNPASNSDAEQTIQTERYRQQLELRQMQSANPNSLGFGAGASYDPAPAAGSILQQPVVGTVAGMGPRQNAANQPSQPASAQEVFDVQGPTVQGGLPVQPAAQGLASLDFELPPQDDLRWTIYYFTTPRGNVEITARSLSDDLLRRAGYAGGTLAVLLCIALAVRRGIGGGGRWIARPAATTTLILLGILALILGVLPVLGFLAIIAGLAMKFSRMGQKSATAS